MINLEITEMEKAEMLRVRAYFPYREVFGVRETDKFRVYADKTKRRMNKLSREGFPVFSFE